MTRTLRPQSNLRQHPYTIVVPAYNSEQTLGATLESLAGQVVPPSVAVVADDGSTDATAAIARTFPRVEWRVYPHSGLAAVQNRALTEVSTPYVAFVDSDDLWTPQTGLILLSALVESGAGAVGVLAREFWDENVPRMSEPSTDPSWRDVSLDNLLHENTFPKSGTMFSTSALRAIGAYDTTLTSCEDLDVLVRLREAGFPVLQCDQFAVAYRQRSTSMSRNAERMIENEQMVVIRRLRERHGDLSGEVRSRIRTMWLRYAARLAAAGDSLDTLPRLCLLQGSPTRLDHVIDAVAYSGLQPLAVRGWRAVRRLRALIAPKMRFT